MLIRLGQLHHLLVGIDDTVVHCIIRIRKPERHGRREAVLRHEDRFREDGGTGGSDE